jgi:hypothetical protein
MRRSSVGFLAGVAGAAFAVWFMRGRIAARERMAGQSARGEVIFRNTPLA